MRTPRKWYRSVRRRKAGIYLARTNRHRRRGRENGYVGRSNNVPLRRLQHLGLRGSAPAKPWADLDPVWHVLRLPWWLSWKWVQVPLEAFAILVLLPRYNHTLNLRNPRRVPLSTQRRQREARDRAPGRRPGPGPSAARIAGRAVQCLGVLAIILGLIMTIRTNR